MSPRVQALPPLQNGFGSFGRPAGGGPSKRSLFYRGHHPGSDFFRVGWPPVHGFLDDNTDVEMSFENYVRTRAYADVFARMLGMNARAYMSIRYTGNE